MRRESWQTHEVSGCVSRALDRDLGALAGDADLGGALLEARPAVGPATGKRGLLALEHLEQLEDVGRDVGAVGVAECRRERDDRQRGRGEREQDGERVVDADVAGGAGESKRAMWK